MGANFKPPKRTLVWYLDKILLDKANIFALTICVLLFIFIWHFFCCYICTFFNSFPFVVWLTFSSYFFLFFVDFTIFCLCSLLRASIETDCSQKWNSVYQYLVFQELLQFLCFSFNVQQLTEVKISTSVSLISAESLFWWLDVSCS